MILRDILRNNIFIQIVSIFGLVNLIPMLNEHWKKDLDLLSFKFTIDAFITFGVSLYLIYFSIIFPLIHLINITRNVFNKGVRISDLFISYIEMVVFFTIVYTVIGLLCASCEISNVVDMKTNEYYEINSISWGKLLDGLFVTIDHFHFSVVTQTTLGYGDMAPTHWSTKIIVDIQVLAGLYFIAVALASRIGDTNRGNS